MEYKYGSFSDNQITLNAQQMHNEIHKLLLFKDKNVKEVIFVDENEFINYFNNLLYRFGGLNELLGEPRQMVALMSTLQAAYQESQSDNFKFSTFRRLIFDSHGYLTAMFGEVR